MIYLKNVSVHNLKSVTLSLKPNQLIVFTGVSGSGKSSLAFDTLYAEGQRRYVESLGTYARRQLSEMAKPNLELASGISPTISIEQKTAGRNPRSTVGTMTEIYDYMRVLYARIGVPHCPISGEAVKPQSRERIIKTVQSLPIGDKIIILSPLARGKKGEFKEEFQDLVRKGYMRVKVDGQIVSLDEEISLESNVSHDVDIVIDRLTLEKESHSRISEAVTDALNLGAGLMSVLDMTTKEETLFSMHAYSQKSGLSYSSLEPQDFSFNTPSGMCLECNGLGKIKTFDLDKVLDKNLSIAQDCCSVGSSYQTVRFGNIYDNLAEMYDFDVHTPWKKLSEKAKNIFLYGNNKKWTRMHFVHPITGATWTDHIHWRGILHEAVERFAEAKSDAYHKKMGKLMSEQVCRSCSGNRLKAYPAATQLKGKCIYELTSMTIESCYNFFKTLELEKNELIIAVELLKEIKERLLFLIDVGLSYLTLDRTAPTLSGGEAQRVRLASQIGCGLVGITYILDEPSIGLHPRDNQKLISTLKTLRDMGNTVIVVEHDEETIAAADHIVDFGKGAGSRGGEIIVDGSFKDLLTEEKSITGAYLSGRLSIPIPKKRRKPLKEKLQLIGATHHNLKNITVDFPLGVFIAVTGVSGSGKSSLITDILYPYLSNTLHKGEHVVGAYKTFKGIENIDKVIAIDQSPIGRNPRSNPSTYIKLFDEIRDLFCLVPDAKTKGYKPGRFSFNVKEGSCQQCEGMGMVKIDMDFMEDAWMDCPLCKGKRFDEETLSIFYKGKNIYDVLEMEVGESLSFFSQIPSIKNKLETLQKVGMEYIKLGQSSTTLSGGEAQRIKLAKELVRPSTGKTFYILDEPTTGLHFHDINNLNILLQELVDRGNTVLVIEHNMDIVKTADWIIDIGPEGGEGGGNVVATGTPEKISKLDSPTGKAIFLSLNKDPIAETKLVIEKDKKIKKLPIKQNENLVKEITVFSAEEHNLKNITASIPRNKMTVCTGPSGSGKTSFAFDTVYAEGQRRYTDSLSPYARQFVEQMSKPKVGKIEGLSPAIAIEQKTHAGNPRSTVGTLTEIYDYLKILFARIGIAHCPETLERIKAISKDFVVERVLSLSADEKIQVLAPIEIKKNERFEDLLTSMQRLGFLKIRLNGKFYELDEADLLQEFDKKRKNALFLVMDRLKVNPSNRKRLFEAVENASRIGQGKLVVATEAKDLPFNLAFAVESTGKSYPDITPHTFAFNQIQGMCLDCQGLGVQYGANFIHHNEVYQQSASSLMHFLWREKYHKTAYKIFESFLLEENIDPYTPLNKLSPEKLHLLMNGATSDRLFSTAQGFKCRWIGINQVLTKIGKNGKSEIRAPIIPYLDELECVSCQGSRLNPLARHVTINEVSISDFCKMPITQAYTFIKNIELTKQEIELLDEVKKQLLAKLNFLSEVGLHYLSLDRRAPTLSFGESQRIRLARQLGSGLTGVLYVLDEPTIGLHPRDTDKLNEALIKLKDLGNTLLLVEHDPLTIEKADYILDFGPKAGENGGHITARGTFEEIKNNSNSLTGSYLSKRCSVPMPDKRRPIGPFKISIHNASLHNLKNINVDIPLGVMTLLTGVSGSGKSTLMNDILLPGASQGINIADSVSYKGCEITGLSLIDKIISIDQSPIGMTSRSDVGTYVDLLTRMRDFFISLPQAKIKGLQGKHFSYNHRRGMCTGCWGMGYRKIEMHFLPSIRVACEDCKGLRLNPVSLEVLYKDKNFGQYLKMTVDEVRSIFVDHPRIIKPLDTLISVGLGYLKLGQEMASLSGGEAQRIKISRELAKRSTGKTLYLLDEPTTGLHPDDIKKLISVLQHLVKKGNTMVIIEHNLDMIKNGDHIIELGPEGGLDGGKIICIGTPEEVAKNKKSWTGVYLKKYLN